LPELGEYVPSFGRATAFTSILRRAAFDEAVTGATPRTSWSLPNAGELAPPPELSFIWIEYS
jgi:hypothetical protein